MKKFKYVLFACTLCLSGCVIQKDTTPPVLELSKKSIIVNVNDQIDYKSYIKEASDDRDGNILDKVTYNPVDTSKKGKQVMTYTLQDESGHEVKKDLTIHVVPFYSNKIYNPKDVEAEVVTNPDDVTVLINKLHELPHDYKPNDLVRMVDSRFRYLRKEANDAYTKFYNAAKKKGISIYTISTYREPEKQVEFWSNQVKVRGEEYASQYSAYPRRSEHELGLSVDVSYKQDGDRLNESVEDSELGKFIISDGYKYGFILRYPKDKVEITNYGYEPWHMRYVGVELATELHDKQLTLEEYYGE